MKNDINLCQNEDSLQFKKVFTKKDTQDIEKFDGVFIDADEKESRKIIESIKNSKKKIAIKARDEVFNRRVLETMKIDYLVSLEINTSKDTLKQRGSGFNHVLAKIAAKNKIDIVVSLENLFLFSGIELSKYIAKIIQNIKICRKAKCNIKIASFSKNKFYSTNERERLGFSWGMSSQQARQAILFN